MLRTLALATATAAFASADVMAPTPTAPARVTFYAAAKCAARPTDVTASVDAGVCARVPGENHVWFKVRPPVPGAGRGSRP